MNKAVIGVFPDNMSASRSINDLKAYGFGGENIGQMLRDDLARGERLDGPRILPAMEVLKGLVVGLVAGGIVGAVAAWYFGMRLTWPTFGLTDPLLVGIFTLAIAGAIGGILEGLFATAPLAAARRALMLRHRGDAVVTVDTDETHAARAADIMRAAGGRDIRRGASSVMDEFRTTEAVQPEIFGSTPVVQRESVEAPAASGEVVESQADGGAIG